jgi:hypothetical protein
MITDNTVPSSLILFAVMMEAVPSSETSVLQEPHGVKSQNKAFFMDWLEFAVVSEECAASIVRAGALSKRH